MTVFAQLSFRDITNNTDMLDLNLPKHIYVFLRKHLEEGVYQVSAVSASDVLKRNI